MAEPAATYLADLDAGKLDGIHLSEPGGAPYPDVSAYLDPRFGPNASKALGKPFADIGKALASGRATTNAAPADGCLQDGQRPDPGPRADDPDRGRVGLGAAFRADVEGRACRRSGSSASPTMTPGDRRQLVWVTTSEPPGLYCADETDPVAGLVCAQLVDGLYRFDPSGATPIPALASSCTPNGGRHGLDLQPADRGPLPRWSASWTPTTSSRASRSQWDADHPLHAGHDGTFAHVRRLVRRVPAPAGGRRPEAALDSIGDVPTR